MEKSGYSGSGEKRWLIAVAGFSVIVCLGVAYSWGIFLLPISEEFGWKRGSVSLAVSLLLLVFSVFMVVGGILEKRYGPKITSLLGGLLVCTGWVSASFTQSLLWLYLSYGVISGIGTGLSYLPSISSGIKWFPDKKGLITGIIIFGFGFGSAFLAPLGTKLIEVYGWRSTMLIYGIGLGTIIILASSLFKNPPADWSPPPAKNSRKIENVPDFTPTEMLKRRSFWIIFSTYFLSMVAGMMVVGHIIPFMEDGGYSSMQSALGITTLSLFNGAGRIGCGALSDRIGARRSILLLFAVIAAATLLLSRMPAPLLLYGTAGVIGFCFGGFLAVYPAATCDYFGIEHFGINYGLVFIGYGAGCFAGPWMGGIIYDITGRYLFAFKTASLAALAGGVISFFHLKKPLAPANNPPPG